jgi:polysaccharide biosynthesis/export protein
MSTALSFHRRSQSAWLLALVLLVIAGSPADAQNPAAGKTAAKGATTPAAGVTVPAEYTIGPEDVLGINFWRDTDMTGDVTVRPDGKVTLPLIGELTAAGLTPEQFKDEVHKAATKYVKDPETISVNVIVRTINSRKVFITGQVGNPGAYPLMGDRTVMQLIALAGGLNEYAKKKNITITRIENGKTISLKFNYDDVSKGKNLQQNVMLKPGDTVVVP